MFVKIDGKTFNTDLITEIYEGKDRIDIYFATPDGDTQSRTMLNADEYARLMRALENKNILYVA